MILRRLATALRKQDWVTVLIETLIVVRHSRRDRDRAVMILCRLMAF